MCSYRDLLDLSGTTYQQGYLVHYLLVLVQAVVYKAVQLVVISFFGNQQADTLALVLTYVQLCASQCSTRVTLASKKHKVPGTNYTV